MTATVALLRAPAGLHQRLAALLAELGEEPVDVADRLRTDGVRGVRGSALAHPVCRWLVRNLPDAGAALGPDHVHGFRPADAPVQVALVPLPPAVITFADRFDQGHYPELELSLAPPSPPSLGTDTLVLPVVPAMVPAQPS